MFFWNVCVTSCSKPFETNCWYYVQPRLNQCSNSFVVPLSEIIADINYEIVFDLHVWIWLEPIFKACLQAGRTHCWNHLRNHFELIFESTFEMIVWSMFDIMFGIMFHLFWNSLFKSCLKSRPNSCLASYLEPFWNRFRNHVRDRFEHPVWNNLLRSCVDNPVWNRFWSMC